ncbi:DMT family transporter [Bacillus thermotolerans]|uniref:Permease of the drug/metabolite transporter (DMT) superfamily n=1 Tax=Bacillus thermotolerans TaxID=1221996 RepID=A0A0F5HLX6_BACTR|nr:DMT family transporter [Bacillus thermotolerans]KKB33977.1 Permease of the drug/metabolite transporter (DMT) superfamily [Bacillus thermotolerans]KKB34268.1 Permease of the drug/metabolite transporter (DMT) superfamily [Bacillus thermotolerans]KKB40095.1 Permease of the drug/metabolite transporter (DMT) superfamily [Bacillus thermotolerans]
MNKKAFLLAIFTIAIWGSSFAAIRASLQGGYSPGHLVLLRFLIASSVFIIYALWPGSRFRLPRREDVWKVMVLGLVGISIYQLGVTFGAETVSAGTSSMLVASAPIFTALIAVIVLKERLSVYGWLGMFIGFIGIFVITLGTAGPAFHISKGALFVLIAAIATSCFFVFQKPFLKRYNPIELTAYVTWAGTLPFFIFFPGLFESVQAATLEANLSTLYTGIFPGAIAYVTWAAALSLGNAGSISSTMYVEPVFAIFVAWIWLHEWPSTLSIIGGIIAVSSVIIVNLFGKRQPAAVPEEARNSV